MNTGEEGDADKSQQLQSLGYQEAQLLYEISGCTEIFTTLRVNTGGYRHIRALFPCDSALPRADLLGGSSPAKREVFSCPPLLGPNGKTDGTDRTLDAGKPTLHVAEISGMLEGVGLCQPPTTSTRW